MFRVYCVANGRRFVSSPCPTVEVADYYLAAVLSLPEVDGGAVEEFRPGLGWFAYLPECERELLEIC